MDVQDSHRAAGLLKSRKARHFSLADDRAQLAAMEAEPAASSTSPESLPGSTDPASEPTVTPDIDFSIVTNMLVDLADKQDDQDAEDDAADAAQALLDMPATTSASSLPSASSITTSSSRIPAYKKIKLADLFAYPPVGTPASGLEFFWKAGLDGLDEEEESLGAEAEEASSSVAAEISSSATSAVS